MDTNTNKTSENVQSGSLALAPCSGPVWSAEVERDEMCERAEELEAIACFLEKLGDNKKACARMFEAEELRRQIASLDKRKPSPNVPDQQRAGAKEK
jgi:hypothetical protein